MPVVTFEAAHLNVEQKRQLVEEFTETAVRVTGLPKETICVFLKENSADNVGVGGVLLSEKQRSIKV